MPRVCGAGVHACVINPAPHPLWSAASVRQRYPLSRVSRSKDLLTGPASAASPARPPLRPPPFRRQTFISQSRFRNFFFSNRFFLSPMSLGAQLLSSFLSFSFSIPLPHKTFIFEAHLKAIPAPPGHHPGSGKGPVRAHPGSLRAGMGLRGSRDV